MSNLLSGMTFHGLLGGGTVGKRSRLTKRAPLGSIVDHLEQPSPKRWKLLDVQAIVSQGEDEGAKWSMVASSYLMNLWGFWLTFCRLHSHTPPGAVHTCCPSFFNLVARRVQPLVDMHMYAKVRPKPEPELEPETELAQKN